MVVVCRWKLVECNSDALQAGVMFPMKHHTVVGGSAKAGVMFLMKHHTVVGGISEVDHQNGVLCCNDTFRYMKVATNC